jgi:2,3-bisphosphoglycerate-independent phosphoglycerate mutase
MRRSAEILADHPVNRKRRAEGKTAPTAVWFWGQGTRPAIPPLKARFGVDGSVISAVDLVRGLGRLAELEVITVPGATGFLDTDYSAKARYGLESLKQRDFLLLHIEAPDEAGHMGRPDLKVQALEQIDKLIVGPLLQNLPQWGDFTLLLMPDHATPSKLKTHSNEPVPFAIVKGDELSRIGESSATQKLRRYTEAEAAETRVLVGAGHRLIEALFGADLPVN